jgi:TDG/mug DNA glycosylase family protein
MRVLICGLNPSVYSAERGIGFARPGNRFWPAALAAGLVGRDRDPWDALMSHGVGFTDLVKRATPQAAALGAGEYRAGVERVGWVAAFLRPRVVCLVGLAGWRAALDRTAVAGPQSARLGGVPVYLMPNPSGLNAHATVASLADHLRAALAMA